MITDVKQPRDTKSAQASELAFGHGHVSSQQRKLSIELPTPRQIYTTGSLVSGIVHLGSKDPESVQEIQVSLIGSVRSIYYQYLGGSTQDIRQETTKLIHRDHILWSRNSVDGDMPPGDIHFEITIPDSGIDPKAKDNNAYLPPSFQHGKDASGWGDLRRSPIGFVKYYVKVRIVRKGLLKLNETAIMPFIFLPPSDSPPPLLPVPPESLSDQKQLKGLWEEDTVSSTIRHGIFNHRGTAVLSLWLPRVEKLPRQTSIPFFLSLSLRTDSGKSQERPSSLPTSPHLDKVTLYLHRKIRTCAHKGVQNHTKTYDKNPTDNFVHSLQPQESDWKYISTSGENYWEKDYIWRGHWTFKETPNFTNRQLTLKYFLVAKVPMHGLGNNVTLTSRELDIGTGVLAGQDPNTTMLELELLPEYFNLDYQDDEDDKKS